MRLAKSLSRLKADPMPLALIILALLSYGRVFLLKDVFWDDNCWLLSVYASKDLEEFLNTGFVQLRRIPLGTFLYSLFSLHKNTNHFYPAVHLINIATQIVTPVFLYLFIKNLFNGKEVFAFFAATVFIAYPIDTTLPIFTNIVYRLGIMLCILSFYFTERALNKNTVRWALFTIAVVLSLLSLYIFMEGSIALEPARIIVIGYIFFKKSMPYKSLFKKTLKYSAPFILACMPLIVYKLVYKPYGIYAGTYHMNPWNLLNGEFYIRFIKNFKFYKWRVFAKYVSIASFWSVAAGIAASIIVSFISTQQIVVTNAVRGDEKTFLHQGSVLEIWSSIRSILLLGIVFLIPPLLMYQLYGNVVALNPESRHGIILQIGFSMIVACFLYVAYLALRPQAQVLLILVALIAGLGVYFNNLNLDMYHLAWKKQGAFWKLFTERFPSLPPQTNFMIQIDEDRRIVYDDSMLDIDNYYDLELPLNALYAKDRSPDNFYKSKVLMGGQWDSYRFTEDGKLLYRTHLGDHNIDPQDLIIVTYSNGELLVNREILKTAPNIPYHMLLDKDFPELPKEHAEYPLRKKFKGFY